MRNLASPRVIKEILSEYEFRFSKSLGQNFLIDEGALSGIVTGAELSSEDFAKKIENTAVAGFGEIVFIIGGSFGLSHEVKALGNIKLSFGKLTLPHQLMRVVLLEQIYRAFTILNHTKYHK